MGGTPAFFPTPRTGELLYSVLARHSRWSVEGPKATMDALFGNAGTVASIDLPNRLDALSGHLPASLTVDALIDGHTLAPYYLAFVPADVRDAIHAGMKDAGGNLHLTSGLTAFRAGRVTRLRFCPDCMFDMQTDWGSPHWRRDHQLPSVLVCPQHGTVLRHSTVDVQTLNRHVFVSATQATCPPSADPVTRSISSFEGDTLIRLARASAALLNGGGGSPADFAELTHFYREELRSRGFMRSRLKVDQVALTDAFLARFGSIIDRFPGLVSAERLRGDWLAGLVRKQRKASHPIEHLLLRDLLGSRPEQNGPCGKGPWPCRNPLADHFKQDVVTDLRIYRNRNANVGIFSCVCGYRYTRSISADGVLGPCRFKEFGPLLKPVLVNLIADGTSLRGVAAHLRIDPKTVATLANGLGLETPWNIRPSARMPCCSVSNDATARSSTSVPTKRRTVKPRYNWRRSDLDLAARVAGEALRLKSIVPPTRVTPAAIERELVGRRDWVAKRKGKLPRTTARIADVSESLAAFRIRRIDYCIEGLAGSDEPVRPWEIMRMAGLRSDMLELVEDRIVAFDQRRVVRLSAAI